LTAEVLQNRVQGLANRFLASPPQRVACGSMPEANGEHGFRMPIMRSEIGGNFLQDIEARAVGGSSVIDKRVPATLSADGQRLEAVDGLDRKRGHDSSPIISHHLPIGVALQPWVSGKRHPHGGQIPASILDYPHHTLRQLTTDDLDLR
jgi:hypothetical protein